MRKPGRSAQSRAQRHIWRFPDEVLEPPGTLAEIFAAEDCRAQNLVLDEIKKVDGFRRCWTAIGAARNPYELIDAVVICISCHLNPLDRLADQRRRMRVAARRAQAAATALEEFASSMDAIERLAWRHRLQTLGLSDPTETGIINDFHNLAAGLEEMLARGALKDSGGAPKMAAFERLIRGLARVFEDASGRPAGLTDSRHADPPRYEGQFWDLVEIIRPVAAGITEKSGERPLAQPATPLARGKFIDRTLARRRSDKTHHSRSAGFVGLSDDDRREY